MIEKKKIRLIFNENYCNIIVCNMDKISHYST